MRIAAYVLWTILFFAGFPAGASAQDNVAPVQGASERTIDDILTGAVNAAPAGQEIPAQQPVSLEAMIGQMILLGFPGSDPQAEWPARAAQMIRDSRIGGVVLFSDNVVSPRQLKSLTDSLSSGASLRPFICVDQEGGTIQRLTVAKGFVGLPSAARVGRSSQKEAYSEYRATARELQRVGINVNFGPVVDLNIDPDSAAIGRLGRSYDRDPDRVIAFARQFIDAHAQSGILTAAKHFPGHGSAHEDPHDKPIDITKTWQDIELAPFVDLISDNFVDMIMVGHLVHPRFSDKGRPASLSKRTLTKMLRQQLGFQGLIVTDDLDMGAIRDRYGVPEAATMAIAAGADLVIVANHKPPRTKIADEIIAAVAQAVADGRIPRSRIEQAYQRIVAVKQAMMERRAYVMH